MASEYKIRAVTLYNKLYTDDGDHDVMKVDVLSYNVGEDGVISITADNTNVSIYYAGMPKENVPPSMIVYSGIPFRLFLQEVVLTPGVANGD